MWVRVIYAYTQSDEISLLFHLEEHSFGRKLRKFNSILAGEASAKFSLLLGDVAAFDCRICQLPNSKVVVDYFRWRQEDAHRNALNAHCYWMLRKQGKSIQEATNALVGMSVTDKNEMLFVNSINFNDLPNWQKRGVGLFWEPYLKTGINAQTGESVEASRRRIKREMELPLKEDYSRFIAQIVADGEPAE